MTHLEPEDILRRALREAAGSVEPTPDGLSRIQARLSPPRPLFVAWLVAAWETMSQFVTLRLEFAMPKLEPMRATLVNWLDAALPVLDRRLRPALGWLIAALAWLGRMVKPQSGSEERPSRYAWVRPVAAMAVVVLVAVAGGLALSGLPSQIARDGWSSVFSGQTHGSGGGGHSPGMTGDGKHYQRPTSGTGSTSGTAPNPTLAPSGSPQAKATPKATPSPNPSSSAPSPSPSPSTSSPSPATSPTPTPSPTDTADTAQPSSNDGSQPA
jgi:hypothetical protein